jgi:hypothetical protein
MGRKKDPLREIRLDSDSVADLYARAIIKHNVNALKAVKELNPKLPAADAELLATKAQQAPKVKRAMEEALKEVHLDKKSRDWFLEATAEKQRLIVDTATAWMTGSDPNLKQTAMRILANIFFGERMVIEQPQTLKIEGFEEGVKRMFGEKDEKDSETIQ